MNKNPLVTIFIPTFQRPNLLKNAIKSALAQTHKDLQVIVCDNASNDETPKIVEEIAKKDPRLHYVCHPKNRGMLGNYEYCLTHVKSKYFSLLSDDDILLPNFCQTALEGYSHYPDIAFFACSTVSLSKEAGVICVPLDHWSREGWFSPNEGLLEIVGKYPVPTTVLFRKEATDSVKIDFENSLAWDCDFLIQLAGQFPFAISKERCGIFIHHAHAYSGSQSSISSINSIRQLISRAQNFPWMDEEKRSVVINRLLQSIYNNSFASVMADFSKGQFTQARKTCLHQLRHCPIKIRVLLCFIISFIPPFFLFFRRKKAPPGAAWKGYEKYEQLIKGL